MREKFKQFLKPSRNLLAQCLQKKNTSIDKARLDIFFKKYKANKNDYVLKRNIRKIDGGCLPPCFRVLQKKILRKTFVSDMT